MNRIIIHRTLRWTLVWMFLCLTTPIVAQNMRYLVKYEDGKPSPQLASKWTKISGGYEFTLDTTQEVSKGKPINTDMVRSSLEKNLARRGITMEAKGTDKVVMKFEGEEEEFWTTLSRARIKADSVQIAMETSGSSGGLRANKISRKPAAGEVKASFIQITQIDTVRVMEVFVYAIGPEGVPEGIKPSKKLKIALPKSFKSNLKKDDDLFFKPIRLESDGAWMVKAITFK